MTPQQLAEARAYGRIELTCDLVGRAIDLAFLGVLTFLLGGPAGWLIGCLPNGGWPETARLALLMLIITSLNVGVSFPLAFYSGFIVEHQFGLSRQSLGRWLGRYVKRHLLEIVFSVLLICGLYGVIWLSGPWWWLAASGAFFVVSIVLGQLAPVVIFPLFNKIEPLQPGERTDELNTRLARLAAGTGLSIEGVFRIDMSADTVKANAMLAGLGKTRRVILGDNLLKQFSPDEIEVIFAHEIGHHVHRHIRKMILMGALYSLAGFWICDGLLSAWIGFQGEPVDYAHFPIFTLPMLLLIVTTFAMLTEPLQNVVSRYFERQCDQYALQRTELRDAYVTAFCKLAKLNKDDPDPNPVEVFLFHSHPPIAQRLAMAEG